MAAHDEKESRKKKMSVLRRSQTKTKVGQQHKYLDAEEEGLGTRVDLDFVRNGSCYIPEMQVNQFSGIFTFVRTFAVVWQAGPIYVGLSNAFSNVII